MTKRRCKAIQNEIADSNEKLAHKARIAEMERKLAEESSSQGLRFRSISSVHYFTEDSEGMDKTETAENGVNYIKVLSVQSKSENAEKTPKEGKSFGE